MRTITKKVQEPGGLVTAEVTTSTEGNSSVEITVDSKGNIKPTVKVYNDDAEAAKKEAVLLWNQLKDQFGDKMLGSKAFNQDS